MKRDKIGLIGVGSMGGAIVEGILKKKIAKPGNIEIYDKVRDKGAAFGKRWKVRTADTVAGLLERSGIVILAVKPQDLDRIAAELRPGLRAPHLLISILAGTPIARIREKTGTRGAVVRAMPNLGAKAGHSVTALAASGPGALKKAERIFSGCGKTVRIEEKYFDVVTAVSGSGPAYFFFLMELLARFGAEQGLSQETARTLAVETALGSAAVASACGETPDALRVMVTSKGGTTEAAFRALAEKNGASVFLDAFQAALDRGRELAAGR